MSAFLGPHMLRLPTSAGQKKYLARKTLVMLTSWLTSFDAHELKRRGNNSIRTGRIKNLDSLVFLEHAGLPTEQLNMILNA